LLYLRYNFVPVPGGGDVECVDVELAERDVDSLVVVRSKDQISINI